MTSLGSESVRVVAMGITCSLLSCQQCSEEPSCWIQGVWKGQNHRARVGKLVEPMDGAIVLVAKRPSRTEDSLLKNGARPVHEVVQRIIGQLHEADSNCDQVCCSREVPHSFRPTLCTTKEGKQ